MRTEPTTIGPYEPLLLLGRGGMGEVWVSRYEGALGWEQLVALKLYAIDEADPGACLLFTDEARAAGSLDHPAIVKALDFGIAGETLYLAMELISGPSLAALLAKLRQAGRRLTPGLVARIGERVAGALAHAHDRAERDGQPLRLIHRDVSPDNVLLNTSGQIFLTDFGIARTAGQTHASLHGCLRGKPSYMSPEQIAGGELDGRSDLFALGTMLYEAACLTRLWSRECLGATFSAIALDQPRALPKVVPEFPVRLWEIIERALEKDPRARWQSAADLAAALRRFLVSQPEQHTADRDFAAIIGASWAEDQFDFVGRAMRVNRERAIHREATLPGPLAVFPMERTRTYQTET